MLKCTLDTTSSFRIGCAFSSVYYHKKNISFAYFEQPVGEGANLFRKGSKEGVPGIF